MARPPNLFGPGLIAEDLPEILPRVLASPKVAPDGGKTMSEPVIAQKAPFPVEVEAGKTYFWCACGKSAKQPFCDGSHKGTDFRPIAYKAETSGEVWFCGCKHSPTSRFATARMRRCERSKSGVWPLTLMTGLGGKE